MDSSYCAHDNNGSKEKNSNPWMAVVVAFGKKNNKCNDYIKNKSYCRPGFQIINDPPVQPISLEIQISGVPFYKKLPAKPGKRFYLRCGQTVVRYHGPPMAVISVFCHGDSDGEDGSLTG